MGNENIQFLLNNELVSLTDENPNRSVLQYLRENRDLTGTKEGCASGDCGACTVTLVEVVDQQLVYKSINACITLLPALDGKQLLSVEHLQQGKTLHPVQTAMVAQHASQCGFCTPGFVMSLFTLQKTHPQASGDEIMEGLAGNLCRCTGYRSILAAAENIQGFKDDQFSRAQDETIKRLTALQSNTVKQLDDGYCQAYAPARIDELAELYMEQPAARLLAGGTDLVLEITQQLHQLKTIIYLGNVPELQALDEDENHFSIGAARPLSDLMPVLTPLYPEFTRMLERLGSLQIRNQASLGGNIANASPIGDTPPVLIVLGASVQLRRGEQSRELALEDLFVDYKVTALQTGEFIQQIILPKPVPGQTLKVYKISKRFDDDISAVLMAINIQIEDQRIVAVKIALGGMAAIPKRASTCEAALLAGGWNIDTIKAACLALEDDFAPLSDVRASASYRMDVAKNLLLKCFLEITESETSGGVLAHA